MALESGTFIDALNVSNPTNTDSVSEADNHIRLIKSTIKATFPNLTAAVTLTAAEINALQGLQSLVGQLTAPAGTRMLFQQSTAPTGWTTDTNENDKALRVVSGSTSSGGSVAFSAAFTSHTPAGSVSTTLSGHTGYKTLTESHLPSHHHLLVANHSSSTTSSAHDLTASNQIKRGGQHELNTHDYEQYNLGGATQAATIGKSSSVGGNSGHRHTLSGDFAGTFNGTPIDLSVSYVDVIIAQKDA